MAALVISCSPAAQPPTLTLGIDGVPLTVDPHLHNDAITWSVLASFYEGLVRFTDEMRLESSLASAWEHPTPTRWRFVIREGARFSSGPRVTSADVVASFRRARDNPASGVRHHLVGIREVTADGDGAVVVETDGPQPTLLNRLAFLMVIPARGAGIRELQAIDGSGPYRVETHDPGRSLAALAWRSGGERPRVERVRYVFSWDQEELLRAFVAGEIDVLRQVPEARLAELREHPSLRVELQPRLQVQMLAITPAAASGETARALADPRVRRALLLALDRARYVREVFRGNAVVASQYVQPVVVGYDPAVQPAPHDPQEARALLRAAGFAAGFRVALEFTAGQRELMEPIAADLRRVGVTLVEREMSWAELLQRARSQRSEMALFGWACSTGDASDFLNACAHTPAPTLGLGVENYSGYADPATDALIDAAEREMDAEQRLMLLQQAQARLLADLPILPLTVRFGRLGVAARVGVDTRHDQWLLPGTFRWIAKGG